MKTLKGGNIKKIFYGVLMKNILIGQGNNNICFSVTLLKCFTLLKGVIFTI